MLRRSLLLTAPKRQDFNLEHLFDYQTTADDLIDTFAGLASGTIAPIKVLVRYS